ncbi:hypothetical protein BJ875DRAFT_179939 [Amylocarpus encephaloides]|uniref:C3H1-type domain-containing protein n=1 Tax=Amylocarpus encephaloides TaxID=45428 RepID=A0A9P7YP33_9HELO|nr:hypothetical protein BJ875DRAFT_179939 [Amylocarpus encephaloides]
MSGQQYNFPPPPPPPGPPSNLPPQHQQPQYGFAQPPQYQQAQRGGGALRGGRGGNQGGRGDFHASSPYGHPQNGFNAPPHGQGPPQNQGLPVGYSGPHQPSPYIGPQVPGPQGPHGPYNGPQAPQWQHNQNEHHPQQHGMQHPPQHGPLHPQHGPPQHQPPHQGPLQHVPTSAPLSAQNYHPNFAPQGFNQPPQYGPQHAPPQHGPQQPPHFQQNSPQQPPYGHSGPPNQQPPRWQGPPAQASPPFSNRGRGRGGFNSGRGGHEAPLMGPPIRMGFDNDGGNHVAQAGNGFPQPYANHLSPPPVQFNQPSYQGFQQPNFMNGGQRPPLDPNPFNSSPHRGRGNMSNNFNRGGGGRGRGDFQFRNRDNHRHASNGQRSHSEFSHKSAGADLNGKKKKKRRTNTLGLTPNGVDHDDSEDEIDDVDEEARLVTLLGPDTPQLPSDLEAWLAERRLRFPTKARREAAVEELRQRREQGRNGGFKKEQHLKKEEGETKFERQQRKAEKLRLELEKLERNMSGAKRKRENGDEGDEDRGQVSEEDSEGSSGEDSAPEATTSRSGGPMRVPPPPKAQLQRHCKYFSTGGTCGKKGKCRFVHDVEVRAQALRDKEANGGKMTLAQRLILNDTAKDDLTILKSIKYLKEKGLMLDQVSVSAKNGDDHDLEYNGEENVYTENLNYGDN